MIRSYWHVYPRAFLQASGLELEIHLTLSLGVCLWFLETRFSGNHRTGKPDLESPHAVNKEIFVEEVKHRVTSLS